METQLKKIRTENGITLSQLSQDIGYDIAYISRCENGKISPSGKYLKDFMDYFGIKPEMHPYQVFVLEEINKASKRIREKYGFKFADGKSYIKP